MYPQPRRFVPDRPVFVEGSLMFADRPLAKPFVYGGTTPAGAPDETATYQPRIVKIEQGRGAVAQASLDVEGFALVQHRSVIDNFWDEAETSGRGYVEAADIVQQLTGAARVVTFDHIVRKRAATGSNADQSATRQPATRVHVDYTETSGPKRVGDLLGCSTGELSGRRATIINLWRPVSHPAWDWPLAVCDARTVVPEDLIATDVRYAERTGEIYYVAHSDAQHWVYVPDLRPDEVLIFKCWDSVSAGARFVPHAAFEDVTTSPRAPPRESVEFRTVALF